MKERGMIFNGEMVRAILDGRKTQTRRIVNWRGLSESLNLNFSGLRVCEYPKGWIIESDSRTSSEWRCEPTPCPLGAVGDRIWVRETFADVNTENGPAFTYRADDGLKFCLDDESPVNYDRYPGKSFAMWCGDLWRGEDGHVWTPSIHMPRWASRILLEITDVRVERLNSMSEEDARAEGCGGGHDSIPGYTYSATPHEHFHHVWASIYGEENWQANPWVWVIEFKRIEGGESCQEK